MPIVHNEGITLTTVFSFIVIPNVYCREFSVFLDNKEYYGESDRAAPSSWFHVAVVYRAEEQTVVAYLDAQNDKWEDIDTYEESSNSEPDKWKIGLHRFGYSLVKIDELIMWDEPLTSDQIKAVYDNYDRSSKYILFCKCLIKSHREDLVYFAHWLLTTDIVM